MVLMRLLDRLLDKMDTRKRNLKKDISIWILPLIFIMFLPIRTLAGPSLLWRNSFDGRIIKTSALCDFSSGKTRGQQFPLRAVMTEKSIYILGSKGKTEKRISLKDYEKASISDDGSTMAVMMDKEIKISTMDDKLLGTVKIGDPQPFVLPHHIDFDLSPDGRYIIVISNFTDNIYFHDNTGRLLSGNHADDLRGARIKFSKNSNYAAIHIPNWGEGTTAGYLLFFNKKGKKLWKFDHKGCKAGFDISDDGNAVVIKANDRLYSLNNEGRIVFEHIVIPDNDNIAVSGNGRYITLTKRSEPLVSLLDNQRGECLFSRHFKGFDARLCQFTYMNMSYQGNPLSVSISRDWTRKESTSTAYLFDNTGKSLWEQEFETNQIKSAISSDGKIIMITWDNEMVLYYLR